jgi:hypothetical protein
VLNNEFDFFAWEVILNYEFSRECGYKSLPIPRSTNELMFRTNYG